MKPYEFLEHTADIKLKAYGRTLPELFKNALSGMFALYEPKKILPEQKIERTVELKSSNYEFLLVEFLSDCLSLSDINEEYYDNAEIELEEYKIKAILKGYKMDSFLGQEIKAVTYHNISIKQIDSIWQATVLFDI